MKRTYELDVYKLAEALSGMVWHDFEETKSWLRKLIRRKVLSESNATEHKAIIEKLSPKLNTFSTVQKHEGQISNFYFLISTFRERLHFF